jgi:hypothetical protein
MTDSRFEEDLARVISEKADWKAPLQLKLRVAAIPAEHRPPARLRLFLNRAPLVARIGAIAAVVGLVAASLFVRYGLQDAPAAPPSALPSPSKSAPPSPLPSPSTFSPVVLPSGAIPLTIQTESEPPFFDGCTDSRLAPVRVVRSGSQLTFVLVYDGAPGSVVWPYGFSAWVVDGHAELLARDGTVVAREGDVLSDLGGGIEQETGDAFHVCEIGTTQYGQSPSRPGFAPVGLAPGSEPVAVCQFLSRGMSNREWSTLMRLGFVREMMIGTRLPTSGAIIKSSWALTWAMTGAPPRTGMT